MTDAPHDRRPERFFVAAAIPAGIVEAVRSVRPESAPGVRLTEDDQIHLTLHFLGPVDEEQVKDALSKVVVGRVPIRVDRVGHFVAPDGAVTLWAGVAPSRELTALHERVAAALMSIGYQPEARAFTPHISLARCRPSVAADYRYDFLMNGRDLIARGIIDTIELFASTFVNDAPRYRLAAAFTDGNN
jgi:RNA 2',3'-cyclic 3'-phosphodiesterase